MYHEPEPFYATLCKTPACVNMRKFLQRLECIKIANINDNSFKLHSHGKTHMPDISLTPVSKPDGSITVEPRLNIIFVHGLGGDPISTWCHEGGVDDGHFWLKGIAEEIEGAAVYTLGYPADKAAWNTGWPIERAATAVLDKLMSSRELRKAPDARIAFVCHSLGGLIVKKLVLQAHLDRGQAPNKGKFLDRIAGVAFLATPHAGSIIANVAEAAHWFVSKSVHDLKASDEALLALGHDYRNRVANKDVRIRHRVYYETVGMWGPKVVTPVSADPGLPDTRPVPVERDHLNICKPESRDDPVYEGVLAFLQDEVLGLSGARYKSTTGQRSLSLDRYVSKVEQLLLLAPEAIKRIEKCLANVLEERGVTPGDDWKSRLAAPEHQAKRLGEVLVKGELTARDVCETLVNAFQECPQKGDEKDVVLKVLFCCLPVYYNVENAEEIRIKLESGQEALVKLRAARSETAEFLMAAVDERPARLEHTAKGEGVGKNKIPNPPVLGLETPKAEELIKAAEDHAIEIFGHKNERRRPGREAIKIVLSEKAKRNKLYFLFRGDEQYSEHLDDIAKDVRKELPDVVTLMLSRDDKDCDDDFVFMSRFSEVLKGE